MFSKGDLVTYRLWEAGDWYNGIVVKDSDPLYHVVPILYYNGGPASGYTRSPVVVQMSTTLDAIMLVVARYDMLAGCDV
jgi:hypothetical protein